MKSKQDSIISLFFDNPTKEWHFQKIVDEAKIARSKADKWLKYFVKQGLIKREKKKGEMPYYTSNYDFPEYKSRKRIFALNKMHESGFLNHLLSLKKAKTVIVFGSFSRSDWYKESDIDVFVYGDPEGLRIADYELKLKRDIQLFLCKDKKDLFKLGKGLIKNIIKGDLIKGDINFLRLDIDA
ncbi:MAG: nucleotidyltransferase domain-containing protein [Candidatus Nanoarchaeia archaeon]|nr:nucleotidyltransferase domain-containing protein [Candidatus Nanoarchaeia archaeon]